MPDDNKEKELQDALRKQETRFRVESFLMKIGATEDAAKLISSSPAELARFQWDGVNLKFQKSDLTAVDDPAAREFYVAGPYKGLFPAPVSKDDVDGKPQMDESRVAAAKAGNVTARAILARDHFGSNLQALDAALADKTNGDDKVLPNGHDKSPRDNPFYKLRDKNGKVVPAVQDRVAGMIRAMGTAKVVAIAANAKSEAAPFGLSISGLPLRH
jgi:hypothetical protein